MQETLLVPLIHQVFHGGSESDEEDYDEETDEEGDQNWCDATEGGLISAGSQDWPATAAEGPAGGFARASAAAAPAYLPATQHHTAPPTRQGQMQRAVGGPAVVVPAHQHGVAPAVASVPPAAPAVDIQASSATWPGQQPWAAAASGTTTGLSAAAEAGYALRAPASARSKGKGGKAGAGGGGGGRGKGKGQRAQRAQVWEGPVRTARQLATLLWREVVVMMRNPADVAGEVPLASP